MDRRGGAASGQQQGCRRTWLAVGKAGALSLAVPSDHGLSYSRCKLSHPEIVSDNLRYRQQSRQSRILILDMLRFARIFLASADKPAIIAAMYYNAAGIYYEQENPLVLPDWRARPGLAAGLRSTLGRFQMRDKELRDTKKTDWPSYVASRCRSVRQFENEFLCIDVHVLNEAELLYDAIVTPHGESDISLHVTLNRYGADDEIDRRIVRLFDVASRWDADSR